MRIYIAGPYGRSRGLSEKQIEKNVKKAFKCGEAVLKRGHKPFVPHWMHYLYTGWSGTPPTEEEWGHIAAEWLVGCDAILMMPGWMSSQGAQKELAQASVMTLKIYYSLKEIPKGVPYGSD